MKSTCEVSLIIVFLGAVFTPGSAQSNDFEEVLLRAARLRAQQTAPSRAPGQTLQRELLAKAAPDECYDGIGNPYPPGPPCATGTPKVNQAYVWGLARSGSELWFGTAPNVHCLVLGAYLGVADPVETSSYVCEFAESQLSPPLPGLIGDWRPPRLYRFDTASGTLTEVTPVDPRLGTTIGIRSGGSLGQVVLLGGPALTGGVNLFAFRTDTGDYLGSTNLPYLNIRKWIVVGGVLYTATGDRVQRWRGDVTDPFQFEEVGNLTGDGAELAFHEGRLFVSTWPPGGFAGLWMSPLVPTGGLTSAHAGSWSQVWRATDYEPDPIIAATYGGGALASFDGYLFWGTMHVPFLSTLAHFGAYGTPTDPAALLLAVLNTQRAISIFRGRDFASSPQVDLLYGEELLPAYDATNGWQMVANNTGTPLFGGSGAGNPFNNYTWTMAVYDDELFVGTMDWSYLVFDLLGAPPLPGIEYGADLLRFPAADSPALLESADGVDNFSNYGIRTMLVDDGLYLGTANPMNLMTDPTDQLPEGGWELIRLRSPQGDAILAGPGPDPTNDNLVRTFSTGGVWEEEWLAYGAGGYGTNVAAADLDGLDAEVVTGPGPGAVFGPQVRAFRGRGAPVSKVNFYAYGTLRFGVNVEGGELDDDGFEELVTGAGPGEVFGPHVRAFNYDGAQLAAVAKVNFFAYASLKWGVEVASDDTDSDDFHEILTGPGPGPVFAPHARGWNYDGTVLSPIAGINGNVFSYGSHGCRVAAADTTGDGAAEGIYGPGAGPSHPQRVRGFDLSGGTLSPLPGFDQDVFPGLAWGLRVGAADFDADGTFAVLAGQGPDPSAESRLKGYEYRNGSLRLVAWTAFDAFPGSSYGVTVTGAALGY